MENLSPYDSYVEKETILPWLKKKKEKKGMEIVEKPEQSFVFHRSPQQIYFFFDSLPTDMHMLLNSVYTLFNPIPTFGPIRSPAPQTRKKRKKAIA